MVLEVYDYQGDVNNEPNNIDRDEPSVVPEVAVAQMESSIMDESSYYRRAEQANILYRESNPKSCSNCLRRDNIWY